MQPKHVEGVPCWSFWAPTETPRLRLHVLYPSEAEVVSVARSDFRIRSGTTRRAPHAELLHTVHGTECEKEVAPAVLKDEGQVR